LLGLLVYGYTTGVFSSRKLERATYDSVAFPERVNDFETAQC
jgi:transposase